MNGGEVSIGGRPHEHAAAHGGAHAGAGRPKRVQNLAYCYWPAIAPAFATHDTWATFLVGLAASVGAGISRNQGQS